jgi:hypothetical protein
MIDSSLVDIESVSVRLSRKRKKLKASSSIQSLNLITLFDKKELQSFEKDVTDGLEGLCFLKKTKSSIHCQSGISINSFIADSNFPQIS